ncbi:hypothetical protein OT109_06250 [Phycisphaeraceae bacterium D3-23]
MMSEKRISLDVIGVAEPCHQDWSGMTGGEQKKFCDSCAKHVHNLSEMTRDDAEQFVSANPTGVCIRFRRDAATGKLLTLEDTCEPAPPAAPAPSAPHGRGRFSGPATKRQRSNHPGTRATKRRASHRMAGHVFVPFLSVFSLIAGAAAVVFGGGRAPAGGPGCVMGMIGPMPTQQPQYGAAGVGTAPIPQPPAGFLAQTVKAPPPVEPPVLMGRIAAPVEPVPQIMGLIAPVQPGPAAPDPKPVEPAPQPPEIMGEIEFIMGDIACPEDPAVAVDPIEAPPAPPPPAEGNASQN